MTIPEKERGETWPKAPPVKSEWKDPACPKCGLKMMNKMSYVCPHGYCPMGLN